MTRLAGLAVLAALAAGGAAQAQTVDFTYSGSPTEAGLGAGITSVTGSGSFSSDALAPSISASNLTGFTFTLEVTDAMGYTADFVFALADLSPAPGSFSAAFDETGAITAMSFTTNSVAGTGGGGFAGPSPEAFIVNDLGTGGAFVVDALGNRLAAGTAAATTVLEPASFSVFAIGLIGLMLAQRRMPIARWAR